MLSCIAYVLQTLEFRVAGTQTPELRGRNLKENEQQGLDQTAAVLTKMQFLIQGERHVFSSDMASTVILEGSSELKLLTSI